MSHDPSSSGSRDILFTMFHRLTMGKSKKRRKMAITQRQVRRKRKQVAQEGNNRSPEEQLAQGINIIRNSMRPLVELKSKPVSA